MNKNRMAGLLRFCFVSAVNLCSRVSSSLLFSGVPTNLKKLFFFLSVMFVGHKIEELLEDEPVGSVLRWDWTLLNAEIYIEDLTE